jgi:adenosine deaminase
MRILEFMHGAYPRVHLTLHAGELAMGLVPPEGLRFHIRESIERAHAERIGHGVSIMSEADADGLLRQMARRRILVEINLSSNHFILGVSGRDHPLSIYMKAGVPVALSTDDAGVSRSDMTHEFLRGVQDQQLSYLDLKRMSRLSLEHSFLPGASLWSSTTPFTTSRGCAADRPELPTPSAACKAALDASEKARVQWQLERAIAAFERAR